MTVKYQGIEKEDLLKILENKDAIIEQYRMDIEKLNNPILGKSDIMELFKCESDKALRILKVMHQMKYANKIGREYYCRRSDLDSFLESMHGLDVAI